MRISPIKTSSQKSPSFKSVTDSDEYRRVIKERIEEIKRHTPETQIHATNKHIENSKKVLAEYENLESPIIRFLKKIFG